MKTCSYCGKDNDELAVTCCGCGTEELETITAGTDKSWASPAAKLQMTPTVAAPAQDARHNWNLARRLQTAIGVLLIWSSLDLLIKFMDAFTQSFLDPNSGPALAGKFLAAGIPALLGIFYILRGYASAAAVDKSKVGSDPWRTWFIRTRHWGACAIILFLVLLARGGKSYSPLFIFSGSVALLGSGILTSLGGLCALGRRAMVRNYLVPVLDMGVNGICLLCLIFVFGADLQHKREAVQARKLAQNFSARMDEAKSVFLKNPEAGLESLAGVTRSLERQSEIESGLNKTIAKVMSGYMGKVLLWTTNWQRTCISLDEALDMSDVTTRQELNGKTQQLSQAMAELENLRTFDMEKTFRDELARQNLKLRPVAIEELVAGFRAPQMKLQKLEGALANYGEGIRGMQDFLQSNWGQWSYDKTNRTFTFASKQIGQSYRIHSANLDNAGRSLTEETQEGIRSLGLVSKNTVVP